MANHMIKEVLKDAVDSYVNYVTLSLLAQGSKEPKVFLETIIKHWATASLIAFDKRDPEVKIKLTGLLDPDSQRAAAEAVIDEVAKETLKLLYLGLETFECQFDS